MEYKLRRLWLNVPEAEASKAEMFGAIFDPERKSWFITEDISEERFEDFEEWVVNEHYSHMVFKALFTMEGRYVCHHCNAESPVICLVGEGVDVIEGGLEPWPDEVTISKCIFFLVAEITSHVEEELARLYPKFFKEKEKSQHQRARYMNHCASCHGQIPEMRLHDFGDLFCPSQPLKSNTLRKLDVAMPIKILAVAHT